MFPSQMMVLLLNTSFKCRMVLLRTGYTDGERKDERMGKLLDISILVNGNISKFLFVTLPTRKSLRSPMLISLTNVTLVLFLTS